MNGMRVQEIPDYRCDACGIRQRSVIIVDLGPDETPAESICLCHRCRRRLARLLVTRRLWRTPPPLANGDILLACRLNGEP